MARPNFFIVGAPRCGTTTLYTYLRLHPDVFMPDSKEPNFFGSDLRIKTRRPSSLDYMALFRKGHGKKCVGEASPLYLVSTTAAAEINEFNPEAKIIIMLRNPVDQMYSMHANNVSAGVETIRTFESALAAEPAREKGRLIPFICTIIDNLLYQKIARYSAQVERYIRVFGRERVHIILFDDLKLDGGKVLQGALDFLGVDGSQAPRRLDVINESKLPKSFVLSQFVQIILSVSVRMSSLVNLRPGNLGDEPVSRRVGNVFDFTYSRTRPRPMNPDTRIRLQQRFADDLDRLAEIIGRDLRNWTQTVGPRQG